MYTKKRVYYVHIPEKNLRSANLKCDGKVMSENTITHTQTCLHSFVYKICINCKSANDYMAVVGRSLGSRVHCLIAMYVVMKCMPLFCLAPGNLKEANKAI